MTKGLTRREFVERSLTTGVSLGIGAALAGCGNVPRGEAAEDVMVGEGALEDELTIYNWSDYVGTTTVSDFEEEFGVRVIYDTYESNEDLLAKLQAGARGYDLICPTGYAVDVLRAFDLLAPIDHRALPNWGNLSPEFLGRSFDPQNRYTVPWLWGLTGIAYRSDLVTSPPDSWGVFLDEAYRGKMTQPDDMRDVIGCWLKYRGHSGNSRDPGELALAKADAIRAKENLKSFVSAPVKDQLIAGDVWIAQLWNGDTSQAHEEEPRVSFSIPREGSMMYLDSMAIPRSARHPRAAHAFLNFMLRPQVAAAISDRTGYGSPNAAAAPFQRRVAFVPTAEEFDRLEDQQDLAEGTALWDRIWTEIKVG
ncbi:MAG: spermidine/putrescine ABC transporter substrate-binding protein [Gemmatimonadales bacterium]|nr:MAG: spermidine/putrescine ABC transporter substrate-binding protein [Gemmatimonadales bacterium]